MISSKNKLLNIILAALIAILYIVILKGIGYAEYKLYPSAQYYSWPGVAAQTLATLTIFIPLILLKKVYVLSEMQTGLLKSFLIAGFYTFTFLLLLYLAFQQIIFNYAKGVPFVSTIKIIQFVLSMFLVGFSEELMFRGVIYNLLEDCFGRDTRKGIILTVLWSGFIFGSVHITNYFSGVSLSGAFYQSIAAIGIGCYFGAIYARTKNIWVLIIIHSLNDMALDVNGGLFGNGSIADTVSNYGPTTFLTLALYIGLTFFLLRKKKLSGIIQDTELKNDDIVSG